MDLRGGVEGGSLTLIKKIHMANGGGGDNDRSEGKEKFVMLVEARGAAKKNGGSQNGIRSPWR